MEEEFEHPFRLRVLMALSAALAEITTTGGYKHDLDEDGQVARGRLLFGERDLLPMLSIIEPALPEEFFGKMPEPASFAPGEWNLVIQGWVEDDPKNPTDPAHVLLADVKRRLVIERKKAAERHSDILGMGKRVTNLVIGPGVVRPPDNQSDKAYFWLTCQLGLVENLENPYI